MRINEPFSSCNLEFIVRDAGKQQPKPVEVLEHMEVVSTETGNTYINGKPMMDHALVAVYKQETSEEIIRTTKVLHSDSRGYGWKIQTTRTSKELA